MQFFWEFDNTAYKVPPLKVHCQVLLKSDIFASVRTFDINICIIFAKIKPLVLANPITGATN